MLMVIFGAGASYDSVSSLPPPPPSGFVPPGLPPPRPLDNDDRPPLANELFDNRREFVSVMDKFPQCKPIISRLRSGNVEQELEVLQEEAEEYGIRHSQLAALRFYLQSNIWGCENRWEQRVARGITNYLSLLDCIERWRDRTSNGEEVVLGGYRRVCLVTFNYDTLLEKALDVHRVPTGDIDSYVSGPVYQIVKVHGSVNWVREVANRFPGVGEDDQKCVRYLIDHAHELQISSTYRVIRGPGVGFVRETRMAAFPAIAIPVERSKSFECPDQHLQALQRSLPSVSKLLIVGWRGAERHFIDLLKNRLPPNTPGLVVARSHKDGKAVVENLAPLRLRLMLPPPTIQGFSRFLQERDFVYQFLQPGFGA